MELKFSANAGFFGLRRDRFTQYQPQRSLEEKIDLVATVDGVTGIELKYPNDFADVKRVSELLVKHGLQISAVNVDIKDAAHFRHGALSARSAEVRQRAIGLLREGMDLAAELGTGLVTTCPLADGYDYPFQIDHAEAWGHFIDSVGKVVAHRRDVTLLLEYQPHEPHARIMLGNVGKMLYVCAEVGAENLGANLDVGHSFAAGESPAEAAALLATRGRRRYIHSNDNTGDGGDWDMMSGTVHFWDWLELLHALERRGYDGWFGGDIAPKQMGPVEAYGTNFRLVRRMHGLLERLGHERLAELVQREGNIAETFDFLSSFME